MSKEREPDEADAARGARLRSMRERLGLSQDQFGKLMGIDRARVSRVESGHAKLTSVELQRKYAQALGCTHAELLEYAFGDEKAAGVSTPAGVAVTTTPPQVVATRGALAPLPSAPDRWVESTPRYMNLEVAVRRAKERGEPYPDDAVHAARILMRRDYDPPPEEWDALLSAHSTLASQFERRERLVLESEVAGPDPSIAAPRRHR